MEKAREDWLAFRLVQDGPEVTLTAINGGQHRGGVALERLSWEGGLDVLRASLVADMVSQSLLIWAQDGVQGVLEC